jgi:Zn-dependent M28 family amino/carboxypeptidase
VEGVLAETGWASRREDVPLPSGRTFNVVAERRGQGVEPRPLWIVGAHLDSINVSGATRPAPGADDNASGTAGLLEIARALAGRTTDADVTLLFFGGEELGLFGSKAHVAGMSAADRARLRAMLNMDMIGTMNTSAATVLLEGGSPSASLLVDLEAAAQAYTELVVQTSLQAALSDHVPFVEAGLPAVLTIEGTDSANDAVHSERDTIDRVDAGLALQILRMNLAYLMGAAGVSR